MKTKFLKYNWEQLIEEDSFIAWIVRNKNHEKWEEFIAEHPEFKKETEKAREVIFILQDEYEELDGASLIALWKKIERFDQQHKNKSNILRIPKAFTWAASIILIIAIGTIALYKWQDRVLNYVFLTGYDTQTNHTYVSIPSGKKIAVMKNFSKIEVNETEDQLIINDSIVPLEKIGNPGLNNHHMNEVVVPFGKKAELVFADGTIVWLNAGSRLAFPSKFSQNSRIVYLEGEACFQVAKNEVQPFVVKTGSIDIRVLGTFFNVSAYPDQETIETVLIKGRVSIVEPGIFTNKEIEIHPNQKADFNKNTNEITVMNESNAEKYAAWVFGWLEYRRESLTSVLTKLERHYDVIFHVPPNLPADDKISGKLDLRESLQNVMIILSDAAGIEYSIKGKDVYVQKKSNF